MNDKKLITTQEMRKIQLELLDKVMSFCTRKSLKCILAGGSLIGAVRHQGFIPWDDDIDLEMPRHDYEIFLSEFIGDNCCKVISRNKNKQFYLPYAKVYDPRTYFQEDSQGAIPIGVNLDIFPQDNLYDDFDSCLAICKRIKKWQNCLKLKQIPIRKREFSKNLLLLLGKISLFFVPLSFILNKIEKIAQSCDNTNSKYVAAIASLTYGNREIMPREWFADTINLKFEGKLYPCPAGYHNILTQMYGDYMTPPPPEKQTTHHRYQVYWKE